MTTDRDFDALLRSWFEASAAPAQPQDLIVSVRSATRYSRPRPAWLMRLVGDPMPGDGVSTVSRFASLAIAAVAVGVAVALGFVLVGHPWRNVGPPQGSETPAASGSPSALPSASPASQVQSFSNLQGYEARFFSDTVGWVATGSAVYRTSDAGATWRELDLPRSDEYVATSIVDADTVFLGYVGDPAMIAMTHDGGASWQEATLRGLPGAATYASLAMRSATTGTVTLFIDQTSLIFQTVDGGASWTGPVTPHVIDVGDFLFKPGMADTHGVLSYSNGKYDNRPFDDRFWVSVDGGVTWVERAFPTDAVTPAGILKQLSGAWIDGSHWLIAIDIEDDRPNGGTVGTSFYESTDDGLSWRYINEIGSYQDRIVMLSRTEWVGCGTGSGARCVSTIDGGVTWRERVMPQLYPGRWEEPTFVSVDHGWLVIGCTDSNGQPRNGGPICDGRVYSRLVETTDGGLTWRPIG